MVIHACNTHVIVIHIICTCGRSRIHCDIYVHVVNNTWSTKLIIHVAQSINDAKRPYKEFLGIHVCVLKYFVLE